MWLGPAAVAVPRFVGGGPLIGRRPAQILARRELAKVNIVVRIVRDIQHLFSSGVHAVPGGWFGLIVFGVLIVLLVVVIVRWARPDAGRGARVRSVLDGKAKTAEDYRRSAAGFAEAGDYGQAIVEAVRAIAAELEERRVLPVRPGRTATELAVDAGGELPELAGDLRAVTRLFDDVRYGGRPGTQSGYELACRVGGRVRTAPVSTTDGHRAASADLLVPR